MRYDQIPELAASVDLLYLRKLLNAEIQDSYSACIGDFYVHVKNDRISIPHFDDTPSGTEVWNAMDIFTACKGTKAQLPIRFLRLDSTKKYILSEMLDTEADVFYDPELNGMPSYQKTHKAPVLLRADRTGKMHNVRDERGLNDYIQATRNQRLENRDECWSAYFKDCEINTEADSKDVWLSPDLGMKYASYLNKKVASALLMRSIARRFAHNLVNGHPRVEAEALKLYSDLTEINNLKPLKL
jgi:hypothetical protein